MNTKHTGFVSHVSANMDLTSAEHAKKAVGYAAAWIDVLTAGTVVVTHEGESAPYRIPCPANYRLFGKWVALHSEGTTAKDLVIVWI